MPRKKNFTYQLSSILITALIHSCLVSLFFPILCDLLNMLFNLIGALNSQVGWVILMGFPIIIFAMVLALGTFLLPSLGVGVFQYSLKKLLPVIANETINIPKHVMAIIIFASALFIDEKLWIKTGLESTTINILIAASCIMAAHTLCSIHKFRK